METEVMEIQKVNEIINKHIRYHKEMIDEYVFKAKLASILTEGESNMIESFLDDARNSASAIAALEMLKKEVNGEEEY